MTLCYYRGVFGIVICLLTKKLIIARNASLSSASYEHTNCPNISKKNLSRERDTECTNGNINK
jgi:hypothetical protein